MSLIFSTKTAENLSQCTAPSVNFSSSDLLLYLTYASYLTQGVTMLLPRNLLIALADLRLFSADSMSLLYAQHILAYTLAYPFLTL